jgi:hypothetical protein
VSKRSNSWVIFAEARSKLNSSITAALGKIVLMQLLQSITRYLPGRPLYSFSCVVEYLEYRADYAGMKRL